MRAWTGTSARSRSRETGSLPVFGLAAAALVLAWGVAGCGNAGTSPAGDLARQRLGDVACQLPQQFVADGGVGRDGIPSLENPTFVDAGNSPTETDYLVPGNRVIGLVVDDQVLALHPPCGPSIFRYVSKKSSARCQASLRTKSRRKK